ncbi:MAG: hypothetical protein SGILL_004730 [Bacillariaceae sp.]
MTTTVSPNSMQGPPGNLTETLGIPTLKVMRLQKPDLDMPTSGSLDLSRCILGTALCLPDSFGVIHVGETFTAYLGAINVSKSLPVKRLTVQAQLQTPTQRWHLSSRLDEGNAAGGIEVAPESGVDTIVSHALEEAGQHILRVEVGYGTSDGQTKTLRKFYRFQVSNPLILSELTYRTGDTSCFVSISLKNNGDATKRGLTISSVDFEAATGLVAEQVVSSPSTSHTPLHTPTAKGLTLFDNSGRLEPGATRNYLFKIYISEAASSSSLGVSSKGIAAGDELGKAVFTWRKACGEIGRLASSPVICPMIHPRLDVNDPVATMTGEGSDFVVHVQGSCLSVDVAAKAAARAANPSVKNVDQNGLDLLLPVTVEPVHPPKTMNLGEPCAISFLIVNHSNRYLTLQFQFRSELMSGIAVCGPSFKNLEEIAGNGGSAMVEMRFIALSPGLLQLRGCCLVNLADGLSIPQPPLLNMFVEAEEANA